MSCRAYSKCIDFDDDKLVRPDTPPPATNQKKSDLQGKKAHITMHTVRGQRSEEVKRSSEVNLLQCIHCNKVFGKKESLDRHASFCFTSQV